VTATAVGIVRVAVVLAVSVVADVLVVSVMAEGLVNVTGVVTICVAGFDIVTWPEPIAEIVVLAGTPGPVMGCPTTSPVVLETLLMMALPTYVNPVNVATLDAVAFADKATEFELKELIVVPAGIPAPVTVCPATTPLNVPLGATTLLPAVTMAVKVYVAVTGLLIVAFTGFWPVESASVRVLPVIDPINVLAGMPVPVIGWPATRPDVVDSAVTCELPAVTSPTGFTVGVPVAALDIVIVSAVASKSVTVVPEGMKVPVIGWPLATPLTLDTDVTFVLPLARIPVGVTTLALVGAAERAMVLAVASKSVI
jgi:hypothetical protein